MNDTLLMNNGMRALISSLGNVDAEKFIRKSGLIPRSFAPAETNKNIRMIEYNKHKSISNRRDI